MSICVAVGTSLGGVTLVSISKCKNEEQAQIQLQRRRESSAQVSRSGAEVIHPHNLAKNKFGFWEAETSEREEE